MQKNPLYKLNLIKLNFTFTSTNISDLFEPGAR